MKIYKVYIPQTVISEIEYYVDIIALDSVSAALNWYEKLEKEIYSLSHNPEKYAVAFESKFHEYVIRNLVFGNYRILYRVEHNLVQILHVKHSKMVRKPLN